MHIKMVFFWNGTRTRGPDGECRPAMQRREAYGMTPAERVKAVYHHETPDYVPFTIYETKVKGRPYEKELMDLDICFPPTGLNRGRV